jgi:hypothetical protein
MARYGAGVHVSLSAAVSSKQGTPSERVTDGVCLWTQVTSRRH